MANKLVQTDLKKYFQQLVPAAVATATMVTVILGMKAILLPHMNLHWMLGISLLVAPITYGITIRVLFPAIFHQTLDLFSCIKSS